jgi:hypothetical protein
MTIPLVLLTAASTSAGGFDRESPYQLNVVLHVADHPFLTRIFKEQVQRELHDSIQAALGDSAFVTVLGEHPQLDAIKKVGLDRALTGWKDASEAKTHFVLIDFVDGRYEIQARQFDGFTGLASPVVRRAFTTDRPLVARTAASLVELDFGPVGKITNANGDQIELELKPTKPAGGPSQETLVRKGDVFAIAQAKQGGGLQSFRVRDALLQVTEDPKDGKCHCRLYDRYANRSSTIVGYRCLKLGTREGPVDFRIVDAEKGTALRGRSVRVRAPAAPPQSSEAFSSKADGSTDPTKQVYHNMVVAQVFDGANPLTPLVPAEILDDQPITIGVHLQPDADRRGDLIVRRDLWLRRVYEASEVVNTLTAEINELIRTDREAALAKAGGGVRSIEKSVNDLTEEADTLKSDAAKLKDTGLDLGDGMQRLQELSSRRENFRRYIAELVRTMQEENDPKRQKWKEMAAQARLLEADAKFDEAIRIYETIVTQGGDDPKLRDHLSKLKEQWKIKDGKHQKARNFIYKTWPSLKKAADMRAHMAEARQSFETCRSLGDRLTPVMLRKANLELTVQLKKEADEHSARRDDDRPALEAINVVAPELLALDQDAKNYLDTAKTDEK